jgi:hypothetical protein
MIAETVAVAQAMAGLIAELNRINHTLRNE